MLPLNEKQLAANRIEVAVEDLRRFYALGKSVKRYVHQTRDNRVTPSEREHRAKARQFADPAEGYSPKDLQKLIGACRKGNWVLSRSNIIRLLAVPKGSARDEFQAKAIAGCWSKVRLNLEIQEQLGNQKPYAGRPKALGNLDHAQLIIAQLAEQWVRTVGRIERQLAGQKQICPREKPPITSAQLCKLKDLNQSMCKLSRQFRKPVKP